MSTDDNSLKKRLLLESDVDYDDTNSKRLLFPILSGILQILPMWITRERKFITINLFGTFITILYGIHVIIDELCFDCIWKVSDSLDNLTDVLDVIIIVLPIIYMPIIIVSQILFYMKRFSFFWTHDIRDNKMVYFLVKNKDRIDSMRSTQNDIEMASFSQKGHVIHRNSKYIKSMYYFINLKRLRRIIWIILGFMLIDISTAFILLELAHKDDIKHIIKNTLLVVFQYIPRSFHCIVISLYLFEWKCRIRYFWRKKFTEYLINDTLIYKYKNLRKLMYFQLKWIKIYLFGDIMRTLTHFWVVLSNIKVYIQEQDIMEGICMLIYYGLGCLLTWIMLASITQESEYLFEFGVKYMEIISHKRISNNNNNDYDSFFYETILNEQTLRNDSKKIIKNIDGKINVNVYDIDANKLKRKYIENKNNFGDKNEFEINQIKIENQLNIQNKIQTVQSFLLFYTHNPIKFNIFGIKINYTTLINMVILYIFAWIIYIFTSICDDDIPFLFDCSP